MRILFYIEPLIEQEKPYWKDGWLNTFAWDMIKTLKQAGHDYNFQIITNEPIAQTVDMEKNLLIHTLTQRELLEPFGTNYLAATTAWHLETYTDEQLEYYKWIMHDKLDGFVPNVIITFTPVPFLRALYPQALVLHHEYSIFSRLPYPASWFLDPVGMHSHSYFDHFRNAITSLELSDNSTKLLHDFKVLCQTILIEKSPFGNTLSEYKKRFTHLVLLPLQFSRYYLFDDLVPFKSQYEYCVYVLDNTPHSIGVVVNQHPEYPVLSNEAIRFLRWKYPHFICPEEFNTIYASGQYILPFVDAVVTVSSSIGLQALLFDKQVITLGNKCFDYVSDSKSLDNIETVLTQPTTPKDAVLYYMLTRYTITSKYLHDPEWLHAFLVKSLQRFRKDGIRSDFYDPIDSDQSIFNHLSSIVQNQAHLVPQYLNSDVPFIQLFLDRGHGFTEESSLKLSVAQNADIQEFVFDLSDKQPLHALRLDPLNDSCVIEVEELKIIRADGLEFDLTSYINANACSHHGKSYFFDFHDPQVCFHGISADELSDVKSLVIKIRFAHIGKDALHACISQVISDKNYVIVLREQELDQTRSELDQTRSELDQTRSELDQTRSELDQTRSELDQTRSELDQTRSELDQTRSELDQTRSELASVYSSKSWKITKPLRGIVSIIKKGWFYNSEK